MRISYTHTLSCGHRIVGYPGKCRMIHGHNYEITFYVDGKVREDGMVLDYAKLKKLGEVLDKEWDHRLLLWKDDPIVEDVAKVLARFETIGSVKLVPFNPTAENMAQYILELFRLSAVRVKEGAKTEAYTEN